MELSGTINRSITLSGSMIARGLDGRGIVSIAKTGTSGLVDTYTITYTDATTSTFTVTNGANGQITATSFAEEFSSSKAYAVGDYVVYSGQLYQFTTAHAAGAWNASHATAVQIADQVSELKSAIDQITAEKVSINRWDGTNAGHYYVNQVTGGLESSASYTASDFIKIDNDSNKIIISADTSTSTLRYALYTDADESTFVRGSVGGLLTQDSATGRYYTEIDVTNASYIRFSLGNIYFANADSRLMLSLGDAVPRFSIYTGDRLEVDAVNYGKQYDSSVFGTTPAVFTADSLTSGQTLKIDGSNSIKKNKTLHFKANINDNAFDSIYCGIGEQSYSLYWKIDATNIYVMSNGSVGTTLPHGLTLSTYIDLLVVIGERNLGKMILNTLGGTYSRDVQIVQGYKGEIFLRPYNCAVTNAIVEFACKDFRQPVWIFGDSYLTHTSQDRWAYWLLEWNFGRCLLNAFPGENAQEALPQIQDYVAHYGTPKIICWCLGMNNPDNSGSVDTLPVAWQNAVETLKKLCTENNITLILSTIPNTPTVSNVLKNDYVRNSGYKYIDFAKAVGAESRGSTWYDGCLSSDNTHPTEKGARLLCLQALQDVPELML